MTTKQKELAALAAKLDRRAIVIPMGAIETLRKAEKTLHRWAEQECGDGNDYASWCITRDEQTGVPYMERHSHHGACTVTRTKIADREKGALKRVEKVCADFGLHYYHQTDPRGCALYIAKEPLTDQTYSSYGASVCA